MHAAILTAGIENGSHRHWPWRSCWPFWLRILGNLRSITCTGFQLQVPNLNLICIWRFSHLVLEMGVIDLDLQGYLDISTQNSMTLFYTILGRSWGGTRGNVLLSSLDIFILVFECFACIHYVSIMKLHGHENPCICFNVLTYHMGRALCKECLMSDRFTHSTNSDIL